MIYTRPNTHTPTRTHTHTQVIEWVAAAAVRLGVQCHLVVAVWLAGHVGGVQQHDPLPQTTESTESTLSCQNHNTDFTLLPQSPW